MRRFLSRLLRRSAPRNPYTLMRVGLPSPETRSVALDYGWTLLVPRPPRGHWWGNSLHRRYLSAGPIRSNLED